MATHYDILGIKPTDDEQTINSAYARKRIEYRRDAVRLREVEQAYRVLANPITRSKYRRTLNDKDTVQRKVIDQNPASPSGSSESTTAQTVGGVSGGEATRTDSSRQRADKQSSKREITEVFDMDSDRQSQSKPSPKASSVADVAKPKPNDARPTKQQGSSPASDRKQPFQREKTEVFDMDSDRQSESKPSPKSSSGAEVAGRVVDDASTTKKQASSSASDRKQPFKREKTQVFDGDTLATSSPKTSKDAKASQDSGRTSKVDPGKDSGAPSTRSSRQGPGNAESIKRDRTGPAPRSRTEIEATVRDPNTADRTAPGQPKSAKGKQTPAQSSPSVLLKYQGESQLFTLKSGENLIGRPPSAKTQSSSPLPDVPLSDPDHFISRNHAILRVTDSGCSLTEGDAKNGTLLNGKRLQAKKSYPLSDGDLIEIEGRILEFHM